MIREIIRLPEPEITILNKSNFIIRCGRNTANKNELAVIDTLLHYMQIAKNINDDQLNYERYYKMSLDIFIGHMFPKKKPSGITTKEIQSIAEKVASFSTFSYGDKSMSIVNFIDSVYIDRDDWTLTFRPTQSIIELIFMNHEIEASSKLKHPKRLGYFGYDYVNVNSYGLNGVGRKIYILILSDLYKLKYKKYLEYKIEEYKSIVGISAKRSGDVIRTSNQNILDITSLTGLNLDVEYVKGFRNSLKSVIFRLPTWKTDNNREIEYHINKNKYHPSGQ